MPKTIQVRDVPDEAHHRLTLRAAERRMSLSEYAREDLVRLARRPTMSEMLARLSDRTATDAPETPAQSLAAERR